MAQPMPHWLRPAPPAVPPIPPRPRPEGTEPSYFDAGGGADRKKQDAEAYEKGFHRIQEPPSSVQTRKRRYSDLVRRRLQKYKSYGAPFWLSFVGVVLVIIAMIVLMASPQEMHRDHKWMTGIGYTGMCLMIGAYHLRLLKERGLRRGVSMRG